MKNHNKGQDDKARANRREPIVPYCGGFPEPDAGGRRRLRLLLFSKNETTLNLQFEDLRI